ncbi:uncharacterized protein At4g26485-like [Bidens hawaiensis]|uniref:uncharacterized protein At4g26485-like n=1 Tax=Bidens hawaiensis TaxID=980011 RepID=UPI00404B8DF5
MVEREGGSRAPKIYKSQYAAYTLYAAYDRENRNLINLYFSNAAKMIKTDGVVKVSNKVQGKYDLLKIRELANQNGLMATKEHKFRLKDYPPYINKRGHGPKADETYPLDPSSLFFFVKRNTGT